LKFYCAHPSNNKHPSQNIKVKPALLITTGDIVEENNKIAPRNLIEYELWVNPKSNRLFYIMVLLNEQYSSLRHHKASPG
jgi:hypothetical protein